MEENNIIWEILEYIDCFGTEFNFYTDRKRKFYTPFGGMLTFLSVIIGITIFITINYSDFKRENPLTSSFVVRENSSNIKFGEEKIWIPWRIRDYYNKKINHTNLFYPLIYYYKGRKNETTQGMDLTYDFIGYKLCNETSMVNQSNIYMINISLGDLFCIDMEDLNMGGDWQADFINYVEFDLYVCEDGVNYNESDLKCTTYEEIINSSLGNSYEMEIYYPSVYYEPTNKLVPMMIKYKNYFYHFSRYSNKIDRLFLQKYIFYDDIGWFSSKIKNYTYWGYSSFLGDSYSTSDEKDLMNEGSTSRLYSFNIYLNGDIICYNRSYKKIMIILANSLPIINVVFAILGLIAKVSKICSGNKKLTELLFVNIKEKFKKINDESYNSKISKIYQSKNSYNKNFQYYQDRNSYFNKNSSNINIPYINKYINNNIEQSKIIKKKSEISENDISSSIFHLNHQQSLNRNNLIKNENERTSIINNKNKIKENKSSKNVLEKYSSNIVSNDSFNKTINNININIRNNPDYEFQKRSKHSHRQNSKSNNKKAKNEKLNKKEKYYVKQKLFPFKYYFYSIFIKNINMKSNKSFFFTKKFLNVYNFICQILDISSYLKLQKEFQTIKSTLMKGKYRTIIENRQKINVNDRTFNVDMKECLDDQNLSILGKIKNENSHENSNNTPKDIN